MKRDTEWTNFPAPSRNIEWTKVRAEVNPEIEERKNIFVYYRGGFPDAVVFWGSRDAAEAQAWLHSVAFARCCEMNCGIRVKRLGLSCGNHRKPNAKKPRKAKPMKGDKRAR